MPRARVEITAPARAELDDASDWYLARSESAAVGFLAGVERAVAMIAEAPQVWPRFAAGTRRLVLFRYPYDLTYHAAAAGRVEIVAFAHHNRKPGYCRKR